MFIKKSNMQIKIMTLTGEEHEIDIDPTERVLRIKEKLETIEGIPPSQQRLIFQGKKLKDDDHIFKYKIQRGSMLHLVIALRGGLKIL